MNDKYTLKSNEVTVDYAKLWDASMAFGELELEAKGDDPDTTRILFFYIIDKLEIDFASSDHASSEKPVYEIKEAEAKVFGQKTLYTAFFIDGTSFNAAVNATEKKMLIHGLGQMTLVMTLFAIILIMFGLWRANSIADKMTKQVITLYENLNATASSSATFIEENRSSLINKA